MSIYENHEEYAKKTGMSLKSAMLRCEHFKKINEIIQAAKKCPSCKKHTLEYEGGSYEEGTKDFIYCDNTEEDCEFTAAPNETTKWLQNGCDFDDVLYLAIDMKTVGQNAMEIRLGCDWQTFLNKKNQSLLEESRGHSNDKSSLSFN